MKVELLEHQWEFLLDEHKFTLLSGGIGSGKSWVGSHWIINRVSKFPDSLHFIGANTFSQLRDSTLACLFGVLSDLGIEFTYNQNKGTLSFLDGTVLCRSLENYNVLRGIEIGSFWLDEVRDLKKEAFDMIMGRLRDKNSDLKGRLTSSPAGYTWLYDYFHPSGELRNQSFNLITAKSHDNPHLPLGYLESLKQQYDDKFYKQEVLGEFINTTQGKVYYAFNREKNVQEIDARLRQAHGTTFIGADFNVDPMSSVAGCISNNKIYILDEFFLRNADTYMACNSWVKYKGASIIPDSTASNRKTSGKSDLDIIRENGFNVIGTRNPFVRDRVNNINRLLSQERIIIDPRCKKLINDLEKVSWRDGKVEIDQTKDKLLSHLSDALGYLVWKLMPIEIKRDDDYIILS